MDSGGYLKIGNAEDREAVVTILARWGYAVQIMRKKRNGKSFDYYVRYEVRPVDIPEDQE